MSDHINRIINTHLFSDVFSEAEVASLSQRVSDMLSQFGDVKSFGVKRYWKIPEYFELTVQITNSNNSFDKICDVAAALGSGWIRSGSSLLWSDEVDSAFFEPSIRWANIELIEAA